MMFVPSPTYSLVLHVDGSHVSDLWHVGVVEGHIEEDCGPEDAGKDEQDHGQSNEHLPDIVQGALAVLIV